MTEHTSNSNVKNARQEAGLSSLEHYTPVAIAVLRIMTALLFMEHGTQKLLSFPAPMESGVPPLVSLFGIGGIMELAGGALLVVGLFTRPVAFLLAGEMAVAYFLVHAPHGFFPILNRGEAAVLYCFVFLALIFLGPGNWSIDGKIGGTAKTK